MPFQGRPVKGAPSGRVAEAMAQALDGIIGAHVDWADSMDLNEWERKALELAEGRSQLG